MEYIMLSNQLKAVLCLVFITGAATAQYIPFPNATKMDRPAPYLNPSINDPLFFDGGVRLAGNNFGDNETNRANAVQFLGSNIYYDPIRKIFINVVTGDYYDPATGLIYRRVAADKNTFVNGRLGPNPVSTKHAPHEKSDPVHLPKEMKAKYAKESYSDEDEDCADCERKGQCYRCKRITSKRDCNACWKGNSVANCGSCLNEKMWSNQPYGGMGEVIVLLVNKLRKSYGLRDVKYNKYLNEVAMIQDLYMAHRGYLNNDNFLANISTFKAGNMTTGYIQERSMSDMDGAERFVSMWKRSQEHSDNLLNADIDACGAAVYYDQKASKFIATLICVRL